MFRSYRFIAAIGAAVCLLLCLVTVQADGLAPSESATEVRSVDQVRAAFLARGYQVYPAYSWDWTLPPVTTFQVRDASSDRVVMVLVYQSAADADTALRLAGPNLVPGYGPSVSSGNVALVQTTLHELERVARLETDRNNDMDSDAGILPVATPPTIAVDLDFQEALESGAVSV